MRVIYVVGHGRSGSTFLDLLLARCAGGASLGQFIAYSSFLGAEDERRCSCGELARECDFWEPIVCKDRAEGWADSRRVVDPLFDRSRVRELVRILMPVWRYSDRAVARAHIRTLEAVTRRSGASVLVDSSKNTTRHRALTGIEQLDVVTVFLYRDVRGVARSKGNGKSERKAGRLVASLSWALQNLATLLYLCRECGTDFHTVSHEELFASPEIVAARILNSNGSSFEVQSKNHPQHMLFGNSIRSSSELTVVGSAIDSQGDLVDKILHTAVGAPVIGLIRKFGGGI